MNYWWRGYSAVLQVHKVNSHEQFDALIVSFILWAVWKQQQNKNIYDN